MPQDIQDENYGKMRPQANNDGTNLYYHCHARDFGRECSHTSAHADVVDEQMVQIIKSLKPPENWHDNMVNALGDLLGDQNLDERMTEIKAMIERIDFRWDQGFITDQAKYLEERTKLHQDLEQLTPIPEDELQQAADLLEYF